MISRLEHLEHKHPPNALSGLFFVLAIFVLYVLVIGAPFKTEPQEGHNFLDGFLFL